MTDYRIEKDSMGEMNVPKDALWGASTARAVQNFPVSGMTGATLPDLVKAYGYLKKACALANRDCGALDAKIVDAIARAADEMIAGKHNAQFVVDVFQAGAGTSVNMNTNEVLANRAIQIDPSLKINPNDHVNYGQSTNDTFPRRFTSARISKRRRLYCLGSSICAKRSTARPRRSIMW
jgi:fumarate hydratase class II